MDQRAGRWTVVAGAAMGALAAYLLGTPNGRRFCNRCVNIIDDFAIECARFAQAVARAQLAASDSWKALEQYGEESRFFSHQAMADYETTGMRPSHGNGQDGGAL